MKRKFVEGNEEGVSAVIGVILMVAITVAIAATVFSIVSGIIVEDNDTETPRYIYQNHSGILQGCWVDVDDKDSIRIGNDTIHDVYIDERETKYLLRFLGENITLILIEYQTDVWYDYDKGDLIYIGAYLN